MEKKSSAFCTASPTLFWQGKRKEILPSNTKPSRSEIYGKGKGSWKNLFIQADNLVLLDQLNKGFLKEEIQKAGGIKLIYIDPPFFTEGNFQLRHRIASQKLQLPAYRDIWPGGISSYLNMLYSRLNLMREILHPAGSIFLHCDWRASAYCRLLLDEIFGRSNFINEIIWAYSQGGRSRCFLGRKHDSIFWYAKDRNNYCFNEKAARIKPLAGDKSFGGRLEEDEDGRKYRLVYGSKNSKGESRYYKYYLDEGKIAEDWWIDINSLQSASRERNGYATQKPQALLERIISIASNPGDLIADFFAGSGTSARAAEKLQRPWLLCEEGSAALNLCKKSLLQLPQAASFRLIRFTAADYFKEQKKILDFLQKQDKEKQYLFTFWQPQINLKTLRELQENAAIQGKISVLLGHDLPLKIPDSLIPIQLPADYPLWPVKELPFLPRLIIQVKKELSQRKIIIQESYPLCNNMQDDFYLAGHYGQDKQGLYKIKRKSKNRLIDCQESWIFSISLFYFENDNHHIIKTIYPENKQEYIFQLEKAWLKKNLSIKITDIFQRETIFQA